MYTHIAIDGPSAAGKSTISKAVARELGFHYMDTGALYRAIAYALIRRNCDFKSRQHVLSSLDDIDVSMKFVNGQQRVSINGIDVTDSIRTPEVSFAASTISSLPEVRAKLIRIQKDFSADKNIVMDGRDIGTNILPNAAVKIYITASPEDRAERRYQEMQRRGQTADYQEILRDIIERDERDMNKKIAPLRKAEDAILVDTTGNTLEKSIQVITSIVKERIDVS